jgi:hypothetical protein
MSDTAAERREEMLGELAERMHAAAREAQRRLLDAETTDDFAKLTGSMAKLARGVRQSILLQRKLEAERREAERRADEAAAADAQGPSELAPRHLKRVRLRTAIARHVWNELEDDEAAELFRDDLNARLDELEGEEDFLDVPIKALIERLCRDLGFEPPAAPASASAHPARSAAAASSGAAEGAGAAHSAPVVHATNTS